MTNSSIEINELTAGQLDEVDGGVKIGPVSIEYSRGCGCIDVSIAGLGGFFFGLGGAGLYAGDRSFKLY